jgi:acetyltransferase-like isoleucine patch superfamily enzyme
MAKNFFRHASNRFLHLLARFAPGAESIRPFLHKLRGVNIQGSVFIGEEVYIENHYPENIEIHDGVVIALRTIIMAHYRGAGKVIIQKNVWIGPNCVIAAHKGQTLTIGEGSALAPSTVVTTNVPPSIMVRGVPATPVAKVSVPMRMDTSYEDFIKGLQPLKK